MLRRVSRALAWQNNAVAALRIVTSQIRRPLTWQNYTVATLRAIAGKICRALIRQNSFVPRLLACFVACHRLIGHCDPRHAERHRRDRGHHYAFHFRRSLCVCVLVWKRPKSGSIYSVYSELFCVVMQWLA
jgi:hypothetical protein